MIYQRNTLYSLLFSKQNFPNLCTPIINSSQLTGGEKTNKKWHAYEKYKERHRSLDDEERGRPDGEGGVFVLVSHYFY